MNEEETIRLFLKNGYQISREVLPLVSANPEQIIEKLGKLSQRPLFVTEEHIKNIFLDKAKPTPKILKEYKKNVKKMKIDDCVNQINFHYEKIRSIILERMDHEKLISINKIPPQTSVFSAIGVVRDKNDNSMTLEDRSGEVCLFFDDETKEKLDDVHLDDIIGVDCKKIKEKIYVKKIYFPDILSSREINKADTNMKIAILFNPYDLDKENFQRLIKLLEPEHDLSAVFVFTNQKIVDGLLQFNPIKIAESSNPQIIQISNIKTLILPKHFFVNYENVRDPMNFMIAIIRRRSIIPSFDQLLNLGEGCFVLDEIPDIIISNFDESFCKNYKGITIVSNSDKSKFILIDLKNREIEERKI